MSISFLNVKKEYNSKQAKAVYSKFALEIGLWESEKIIIEKYCRKSDCILDLGCGAGRTTFGMFELGFSNLVGADISKGQIKCAKRIAKQKNIKIPFVVANAMVLPFPDASFDSVIFSYNGIMCIPKFENRVLACKEINRVLKPNGIFIFTAHDRDQSSEYVSFWKEEQKKWLAETHNKELHEFGDRIVPSVGGVVFIHIPNMKEVYSMLSNSRLKLIFSKTKSDICKTPKTEDGVFGECKFFVAQKNIKDI